MAQYTAAAIPATPAPITAIFLTTAAGLNFSSVSRQATGLTKQLAVWPKKTLSKQAWLQAMQVLISSTLPLCAFFTQVLSAKKGRAIEIKSA